MPDDFECILLDDSPAAVADIEICPKAVHRLYLITFFVAGEKPSGGRGIAANTHPSFLVVLLVGDGFLSHVGSISNGLLNSTCVGCFRCPHS